MWAPQVLQWVALRRLLDHAGDSTLDLAGHMKRRGKGRKREKKEEKREGKKEKEREKLDQNP